MIWNQFNKRMSQAPAPIQQAWEAIHRQPRSLFDGLCHEWGRTPITAKIEMLRMLDRADLLDTLLRAYVKQYQDRSSHVLGGMGVAVLQYAEAGYVLRLPGIPFTEPRHPPVHIASLVRMLEDHQLDCAQYPWLVHELHRLRRATEQWLMIHEGKA